MDTPFELGGRSFKSRLIVGTGKYKDFAETRAAVEESGAEIVTVAVRRVNITDSRQGKSARLSRSQALPDLPNTAGCVTAGGKRFAPAAARESASAISSSSRSSATLRRSFPATSVRPSKRPGLLVKDGFR